MSKVRVPGLRDVRCLAAYRCFPELNDGLSPSLRTDWFHDQSYLGDQPLPPKDATGLRKVWREMKIECLRGSVI